MRPLLFALILLFAPHHGTSTYDMDREIAVTGTIKEWSFANPHTWLWLTVSPTEEWSIEGAPPNFLLRQGWSPTTLRAGEKLTVLISPLKGQLKRGILLELKRSNGETLVMRPRGSFGRPSRVN